MAKQNPTLTDSGQWTNKRMRRGRHEKAKCGRHAILSLQWGSLVSTFVWILLGLKYMDVNNNAEELEALKRRFAIEHPQHRHLFRRKQALPMTGRDAQHARFVFMNGSKAIMKERRHASDAISAWGERLDEQEEITDKDLEQYIHNAYPYSVPLNCRNKLRLVWIYIRSNNQIPDDLCNRLPTWENVTEMYGKKTVGFQDCGALVDTAPTPNTNGTRIRVVLEPRFSSLPESGVTLLRRLLSSNFPDMEIAQENKQEEALQRKDLHWAVSQNEAYLRIILVKHPFFWMQSICFTPPPFIHRQTPEVFQDEDEPPPCRFFLNQQPLPLGVSSRHPNGLYKYEQFKSLLQYWNEWNTGYLIDEEPEDVESTQPFMLIRYEDLLFHTGKVIRSIGECAQQPTSGGLSAEVRLNLREMGRLRRNPTSGLMDQNIPGALRMYSSWQGIADDESRKDFVAAKQQLNPKLLDILQYKL